MAPSQAAIDGMFQQNATVQNYVCVYCIAYIQYCLLNCRLNCHTVQYYLLYCLFRWLVFDLGARVLGNQVRPSESK